MTKLQTISNESIDEIQKKTNSNFNLCLHCKTCTNGCPFIAGMDYPPNAIIRLVQLGMVKQALTCSTIWVCVGCNTCSFSCPMAIDIPSIMDELREQAIKNNIKPAEPDILNFHNEVLKTIKKYGRTHKLEIMMRFKFKTMDLLSDMGVGLKMLQKRKLNLLPSKIKNRKSVEKIFKNK